MYCWHCDHRRDVDFFSLSAVTEILWSTRVPCGPWVQRSCNLPVLTILNLIQLVLFKKCKTSAYTLRKCVLTNAVVSLFINSILFSLIYIATTITSRCYRLYGKDSTILEKPKKKFRSPCEQALCQRWDRKTPL